MALAGYLRQIALVQTSLFYHSMLGDDRTLKNATVACVVQLGFAGIAEPLRCLAMLDMTMLQLRFAYL